MNNNVAEQINQTIEDIWMILGKKERAYTNFHLNNQQHVLLTLIMRNPQSTTTNLARKMEVTNSAASQHLAKLEREGYITRKQHPGDKRTYSIILAEKGLQYKKEMENFHRHISETYHKNLSFPELTNVLNALQNLQNALESE